MSNHGGHDGIHIAKHQLSRDPDVTATGATDIFPADMFPLTAMTQGCSWNATGPSFIAVHQFLEAQYRELFEAVEQIAERARALRVIAPCGLLPLLQLPTLEEGDYAVTTDQAEHMLVDDHTSMADQARDLAYEAEEAQHPATQDMLVGRIAVHQKAALLLRSHLH